VLVVDDEPDVRAFIWLALATDPDFVVCGEAADGAEAVDLVSDLHPDVVLLDIRMPVMDGIEAARKIKSICPGTRIVVLSAHPSSVAEVPGADWYLEKAGAPPAIIKKAVLELMARG
jgi:YesN/AraC family two-component response regulator